MAILLTQTATNNGSGDPTVTLSSAISVGDLIVYSFALPTGLGVTISSDPSDDLGNDYGGTDMLILGSNLQIWTYSILSGFAGAGAVISGPGLDSASRWVAHARVYSGVHQSTFIDDTASAAIALSGSPHTNSAIGATTVSNCALVGFYAYRTVQDASLATVYSDGLSTEDQISNYDLGGTIGMVSSDTILPTATTNTMSATFSGANKTGVFAEYAFRPSGRKDFLPILGVS